MRVIKLIGGYLWIMIFIESLVLIYIDQEYYKKKGYGRSAKAAKIMGICLIFAVTILYITKMFFFS